MLAGNLVVSNGMSEYYVPNNWAFAPVFIESVSDAPAVIQAAGYLSPTKGNSYTYKQVSTNVRASSIALRTMPVRTTTSSQFSTSHFVS